METLKDRLIKRALEEGFVAARLCRPDSVPEVRARLSAFLEAGYHGQMAWMERRAEWRGNPAALWPEAKSILMLADSYAPKTDPMEPLNWRDRGVISVYAQNRDYHDVVKKRLKRLGHWLIEVAGGDIKVFVDTAPVPEKALGQAAGLGWQGKHTNLVSRDWGNWAFLGSIFTTLEIETDPPEIDRCGSCRSCLDVCPTQAFPAPYKLDARRCISYLTIEHHGPVPEELRPLMGNRIYGCDDCLAVCPWNKFAAMAHDIRYNARADLIAPKLAELAVLDDAGFRKLFSGSPIKRIGRDRFVRNVLYSIGNSRDTSLCSVAQRLCSDPDDTVADAARWAVACLTQIDAT